MPGLKLLAVAVDDASPREVVRRQLHADAIARRDADEVAAHAPRRVGDELVPVFELHLEHRVRQRLRDDGVHHDRRLLLVSIVTIRLAHLWRSRTSTWTFRFPQDSCSLLGDGGRYRYRRHGLLSPARLVHQDDL